MGKWTVEIIKRSNTAKGLRRAAGSSSLVWHGSTETATSPKTSSRPSPPQPHGSLSPPSNFSSVASHDYEITGHNFESESYRYLIEPRYLVRRPGISERRIKPAHVIAWSCWRRAHQAAARCAHLKLNTQL